LAGPGGFGACGSLAGGRDAQFSRKADFPGWVTSGSRTPKATLLGPFPLDCGGVWRAMKGGEPS